jgi:H+/Cl- antiporter ClcA
MHDFLKKSFTRRKLKHLFISSTFGNFIGFIAGSIVATLSTYHSYGPKAFRNLYGLLPREKVVVHLLPHWAEWVLATLVGFIVMELVSYFINNKMHLLILEKFKKKHPEEKKPES